MGIKVPIIFELDIETGNVEINIPGTLDLNTNEVPLRIQRLAGNYGGGFANFTPPAGQEGQIMIVQDTNATNPGVRLYAFSGGAWHYVNLT